jgi:hypothetical protein
MPLHPDANSGNPTAPTQASERQRRIASQTAQCTRRHNDMGAS